MDADPTLRFIHHYKPDLSQFRATGSKAWVLIQKAKRERLTLHKLQLKAVEGWLVGMSASNIYRVWIPEINRVVVSREIRIDEGVKYDPRKLKDGITISQRKITTVLEHDLDDDEIQELIKENEIKRRAENTIDEGRGTCWETTAPSS